MYRNTLILFSIILIVIIISTYFINKNRKENFEDIYFGILPKENHSVRIGKLLYYNDPIFIEYGSMDDKSNKDSSYVLLKEGNAIGKLEDSITIINYIKPKNVKKGLTPISYNESLYLRSYPENNFNNTFTMEFKIVPYSKPENNQQPYVELNDFICFKTEKNEYLVIEEGTNKIKLLNSSSVPNNGIFRLTNSPQCFINYKMYGVDIRKAKLSTFRNIVDNAKKYLEEQKKKVIGDDEELREMKEKETQIKEEIQKLENSGEVMALELSNLKNQYDIDLKKIRESIENRKLELKKQLEVNKQLAENVLDEKYLKDMKVILDKGCL